MGEFISWLWSFFVDFWGLIEDGIAHALAALTVASIKTTIWGAGMAWNAAKIMISDLQLSAALSSAWAGLSPEVAGLIAHLKVPEAINTVLSALGARLVMRFNKWMF